MRKIYVYFYLRLTAGLMLAVLTFLIGFAAQSVWSERNYIIDRCGEFLLRGQD